MGKLGQLLVARGWITVQQLTRALQNQNAVGGRLGTCLLEMDVLGEDLLARSLSEQLGVPAANIEDLRGIADEVLHLIPEKLARRCRAIPFRVAGGRLDVAMQEPRNLVCQDEIAFACGRRVKVHVLHELRIYEALQRYYREECPGRFSLLLDRLNRARYLWGATPGEAAASRGGKAQTAPTAQRGALAQMAPTSATSPTDADDSTEVLSRLPADDLLGGPPELQPPPLPEPALPPLPRLRSLFRARTAAPKSPPASGDQPGQAAELLPPLEELDLRPPQRRPRDTAPPPETVPPSKAVSLPQAVPPPTAPPSADAPPLAAAALAQAPGAAAAAAAGASGPAAGTRAGTTAAPDLDTTAVLGPSRPPASTAAAIRKIVLTDDERAEVILGTEAGAATGAVPVQEAPSSLAEIEEALGKIADLQEVGRIVIGFLGRTYRRAALFQVSRDKVTAWMAQGDDIDQEAFARYSVDFKQPSVFLNLRQGSGVHLGPMPPMQAHRELALCWGGGLPRDCVVLPVRLRDRLVTVIYADGSNRGLGGIDLELMRRLTDATAAAFERCILGKKRGYAQP